ncbi:hypothetical protein M0Q39_01760 [Patescibacteria group bacterium]|nr:hypothetical protein [Patescibacteria group bacterium]
MQFPNNLNLKPANIFKIAGLALVVIIVITLAFRLIGSSFKSLTPGSNGRSVVTQDAMFDMDDEEYAMKDMGYGESGGSVGLSIRNVIATEPFMPPMDNTATMGDDAEDFEVTEYGANIETRHLEDTCKKVADLKSNEDVIFENANEYERSCNYNFKVKHDSVNEILAIIEELDPKELNENTYTIKRLIDDYTSEVEILEKKMASIEETLNNAVSSYDDITDLATRTQDVESLAKIIDSKIRIIERLTQEKININAQLERINRSKAEQLDRLEYTYFNVRVVENKFIDGQNLKESWKVAVKSFVRDINTVAQDITINLVSLLFLILQYIIYLFIMLIIAKYGWKFAKNVWKK